MNSPDEHIDEQIIGYDAREYWLNFEQSWTEQRKQGFLYRFDILKPLSVDTRVWPTIFESEQRPVPIERFGFQNSWADLDTLRLGLSREYKSKPMRAWRVVAITLMQGSYCEADAVPWQARLPPVNPVQRDNSWEFLGYDVADQWMLSVLSNCGFLPGMDEVDKLRSACAPLLNKFHLFGNLKDAIFFKKFSDRRLRDDHAPCFVYGIWIVKM
ncbi:MAG: hypothetical protein DM484_08555 [Candidatus Methylumidiphilus alinenensis]|uniref:Uncharacterized protein n=1 Tax=Candidatus Methylumidiphilus alinenensis TaxID=2202197 RepID=A0A2W4RNE9_9GAMM|nr:MAG: hypothetical protein DM484_08555 [Candidatus Methylumidiphilus alinenensis]